MAAYRAALLRLTADLVSADAACLERGLLAFQGLCICAQTPMAAEKQASSGKNNERCGIEIYATSSPQCLELVRAWGSLDLMLAIELDASGVVVGTPHRQSVNERNCKSSSSTLSEPDVSINGRPVLIQENNPDSSGVSQLQHSALRIRLAALVLDAFSLVLEHGALDELHQSAQIRESLALRLLNHFLRPLYRLFQRADCHAGFYGSAARFLSALTLVSPAVTSRLIMTFNFSHPGFQKLSSSGLCTSLTTVKQVMRQGGDLLSLGILGGRCGPRNADLHRCRKHFSRFCRTLLSVEDRELLLRVLHTKNVVYQLTRYLIAERPEECERTLTVLRDRFLQNPSLSYSEKQDACRPALLRDFAFTLGVYSSVLAGFDAPQGVGATSDAAVSVVQRVECLVINLLQALCTARSSFLLVSNIHQENWLAPKFLDDVGQWLRPLDLTSMQTLAYSIVKAHPNKAFFILKRLQGSLGAHSTFTPLGQPRLSVRWLQHSAFLASLLSLEWPEAISNEILTVSVKDEIMASHSGVIEGESKADNVPLLPHDTPTPKRQPWCAGGTAWKSQMALAEKLVSWIVVGEAPLLTRRSLTAALHHPLQAINFVGLTLTFSVCLRTLRLKERLLHCSRASPVVKHSSAVIWDHVQKRIAAYLPEMSTLVYVFQAFLAKKDPAAPFSLFAPFGFYSAEDTIPFETESKTERDQNAGAMRTENATGDSEDDDLELPGLQLLSAAPPSDTPMCSPAETGFCPNGYTPLCERRYALHNALQNVIEKACLEHKSSLFPSLPNCFHRPSDVSFFTRWSETVQALSLALGHQATNVKYDWSQILGSPVSPFGGPSASHAIDKIELQSLAASQVAALQLLDVVWQLHCTGDEEAPILAGTARTSVPLRSRWGKYYILWIEKLVDLWGLSLGRTPNYVLPASVAKPIERFCRKALFRVMEKSLFFSNPTFTESNMWITALQFETSETTKTYSSSFTLVFLSILRNLFLLDTGVYLKTSANIRNALCAEDAQENSQATVVPPVSLFSVVLCLIFLKTIPDAWGLPKRFLHFQWPTLQFWNTSVHSIRSTDPLNTSCFEKQLSAALPSAQAACSGIKAVLLEAERQRNPFIKRYLQFLIVDSGSWRNVFCPKNFKPSETRSFQKSIKKTLNRHRENILEVSLSVANSHIQQEHDKVDIRCTTKRKRQIPEDSNVEHRAGQEEKRLCDSASSSTRHGSSDSVRHFPSWALVDVTSVTNPRDCLTFLWNDYINAVCSIAEGCNIFNDTPNDGLLQTLEQALTVITHLQPLSSSNLRAFVLCQPTSLALSRYAHATFREFLPGFLSSPLSVSVLLPQCRATLLLRAPKVQNVLTPREKFLTAQVSLAILDIYLRWTQDPHSIDLDETQGVTLLVSTWLVLINALDTLLPWALLDDNSDPIDGDPVEKHDRKKSWSRQKQRKTTTGTTALKGGRIPYLKRIVGSLFLPPFIRSQMESQLRLIEKTNNRRTPVLSPYITTFLRHLVCLAWLRVQILCSDDTPEETDKEWTGVQGDVTGDPFSLSYGLPEVWLDILTQHYTCSLSPADRLIRLILQDPENRRAIPVNQWAGTLYDFRDAFDSHSTHQPLTSIEDVALFPGVLVPLSQFTNMYSTAHSNWLQLAPERVAVSLQFFPFDRKFSPLAPLDTSLVTAVGLDPRAEGADFPNVLFSWQIHHPDDATIGTSSASSQWAFRTLIYDPAYLLPFFCGRLRCAWYIVEEQRRFIQGRPPGPFRRYIDIRQPTKEEDPQLLKRLHPSQMDNFDANLTEEEHAFKHILKKFALSLDMEGVWLRQIASSGVLEYLLMGLSCSDPVLRDAATEALSIYRALLLASKSDSTSRASRQRHRRLWSLAAHTVKAQKRKEGEMGKRRLKLHILKDDEIRPTYDRLIEQEPLVVRHAFKELPELFTLLEVVRNTLAPIPTAANSTTATSSQEDCHATTPSPTCAQPCPTNVTTFATVAVRILLNPAHPLYMMVNNYLVSRPRFDPQEFSLILTLYWTTRPGTCHMERRIAVEMISKAIGGSQFVCPKTLPANPQHTILLSVWNCLSRNGIVPLLFNLSAQPPPDIQKHGTQVLQNFTRYTTLWRRSMSVFLSLTREPLAQNPIPSWLVKQFGLCEWLLAQLADLLIRSEFLKFLQRKPVEQRDLDTSPLLQLPQDAALALTEFDCIRLEGITLLALQILTQFWIFKRSGDTLQQIHEAPKTTGSSAVFQQFDEIVLNAQSSTEPPLPALSLEKEKSVNSALACSSDHSSVLESKKHSPANLQRLGFLLHVCSNHMELALDAFRRESSPLSQLPNLVLSNGTSNAHSCAHSSFYKNFIQPVLESRIWAWNVLVTSAKEVMRAYPQPYGSS